MSGLSVFLTTATSRGKVMRESPEAREQEFDWGNPSGALLLLPRCPTKNTSCLAAYLTRIWLNCMIRNIVCSFGDNSLQGHIPQN